MKEYYLILTAEEVATIGEALGNMPFIKVTSLIDKIQKQITEQNKTEENGTPENSTN